MIVAVLRRSVDLSDCPSPFVRMDSLCAGLVAYFFVCAFSGL